MLIPLFKSGGSKRKLDMKKHIRSLIRLLNSHIPECLIGAEIGVWKGELSQAVLSTFPRLHMILVDPWEQSTDGGGITGGTIDVLANAKAEAFHNLSEFRDRVAVMETQSSVAAKKIEPCLLDFVFIDARHDYENVKVDLQTWYPKVRPGGLVCGHDYSRHKKGVIRAVHELADEHGRDVGNMPGLVWWFLK